MVNTSIIFYNSDTLIYAECLMDWKYFYTSKGSHLDN